MKNPASIQPDSFSSELDPIADDNDIVLYITPNTSSSEEKPSSLQYHIVMARLAYIVRTYVKASRGASEANLVSAMAEVEKITSEIPKYLQRDQTVSVKASAVDQQYPWLAMQRYLLTHVLQFIRLTIARASLGQWLRRQPDRNAFHRKAIKAADIIVAEKLRGLSPMYQKSWYAILNPLDICHKLICVQDRLRGHDCCWSIPRTRPALLWNRRRRNSCCHAQELDQNLYYSSRSLGVK